MHTHSLDAWQHPHDYLGRSHHRNERRTIVVVALTAVMMVAEIIGGHIYGSMALVADGWHMSTHAGALGIAALAYWFARRHTRDPRFTFGTGKLGELAAFASAIMLLIVALIVVYESGQRLLAPVAIDFHEAILIAAIGLLVNVVSAVVLYDAPVHHHAGGGHHHHHDHHHHADHNMRAAFVHVLADALTSVLAIVALAAGWLYGWTFLDPVMGLVGAVVIASWSVSLLRSSGATLVDAVPDEKLRSAVQRRLEVGSDRLCDLHLWRLGPGHTAVIASIVSDAPQAPDAYKARLRGISGLSHVTVEVHRCRDVAA